MQKLRSAVMVLTILGLLFTAQPAGAQPQFPYFFYGEVTINGGENVPVGAVVSAWINGVRYAYSSAYVYEGVTWYNLTVPADDPTTTLIIEGGKKNDVIHFHIGPFEAAQTFTWNSATTVPLNLTATGTNHAPIDISLSTNSILENAPIGTVVGTFSTIDADAGDLFTYAFAEGIGDTDNDAFSLIDNQLKTAILFNYDLQDSYSIRIRSTDSMAASYEKVFTINVTDVNSAPVISQGETVAVKMTINGSIIPFQLDLSATDVDVTDTLSWDISNQAEHGEATVIGIGTMVSVNYIPGQGYYGNDDFVVRVSDGHGSSDSISVTVNIYQTVTLPLVVR